MALSGKLHFSQGIAVSETYERQNGRGLGPVNYYGKHHSYGIMYRN